MTKTNTLQAKLAASLDKANKKAPAAKPKPTKEAGCQKLSISLFSGDMARLAKIQAYMADHGEFIKTSEAIKIALRTAPISDALTKALAEARAEDGRGKW